MYKHYYGYTSGVIETTIKKKIMDLGAKMSRVHTASIKYPVHPHYTTYYIIYYIILLVLLPSNHLTGTYDYHQIYISFIFIYIYFI